MHMRRADRNRERLDGMKLHNIMAIPIYTSLQNANLIKSFSKTIKPSDELPNRDFDALRVAIATRKGKALTSARSKLADSILSQWAKVGPADNYGTFYCVGVVQVINGLTNMRKGPSAGFRYFTEEDEEVRA